MTDRDDAEVFERFAQKMARIEAHVKDPPPAAWAHETRSGGVGLSGLKVLQAVVLTAVVLSLAVASASLLAARKAGAPTGVGASTETPGGSSTVDATPVPSNLAESGLDMALGACGAGMVGQNPVIGSFEAPSPMALYQRLPDLIAIPELNVDAGPIDVVLFGSGDFVYPVPVMRPAGSSQSTHVDTMLCIVRNGAATFYPDVNLSGWTP